MGLDLPISYSGTKHQVTTAGSLPVWISADLHWVPTSHITPIPHPYFSTYIPSSPLTPKPKQADAQLRFLVSPFMQVPVQGLTTMGSGPTQKSPCPTLGYNSWWLIGHVNSFQNRSLSHPTIPELLDERRMFLGNNHTGFVWVLFSMFIWCMYVFLCLHVYMEASGQCQVPS